jgi:hypothetical protein
LAGPEEKMPVSTWKLLWTCPSSSGSCFNISVIMEESHAKTKQKANPWCTHYNMCCQEQAPMIVKVGKSHTVPSASWGSRQTSAVGGSPESERVDGVESSPENQVHGE